VGVTGTVAPGCNHGMPVIASEYNEAGCKGGGSAATVRMGAGTTSMMYGGGSAATVRMGAGTTSMMYGGGSAATARMGAGTTSMISTHGRGTVGVGTLHVRMCVCMYEEGTAPLHLPLQVSPDACVGDKELMGPSDCAIRESREDCEKVESSRRERRKESSRLSRIAQSSRLSLSASWCACLLATFSARNSRANAHTSGSHKPTHLMHRDTLLGRWLDGSAPGLQRVSAVSSRRTHKVASQRESGSAGRGPTDESHEGQ
jgi:hypothetical protein